MPDFVSPSEQIAEVAKPLAPGSTIGILGGGQLGRMLAMAAAELGFKCHVYCPDEASPAFDVSAAKTVAAYDDRPALAQFGASVDVVTYEFENVDLIAAEFLAERVTIRPGVKSLLVAQDRLAEKNYLREHGIAVAPFQAISTVDEVPGAIDVLGLPLMIKTRRLGYDGKGQVKAATAAEVVDAFTSLGEVPAIAEKVIDFERELSVIAVGACARSAAGGQEVATYDVTENVHCGQILHTSTVPARISAGVAGQAETMARTIATGLGHVGALGVEFFHVPADDIDGEQDGLLLVNEIAPRVHNSGHWTLDACVASQFANHIRAIAGWPLLPTDRHSNAVMTNLIGDDINAWRQFASAADTVLHVYGKTVIRAGRKMGHMTRLSPPCA